MKKRSKLLKNSTEPELPREPALRELLGDPELPPTARAALGVHEEAIRFAWKVNDRTADKHGTEGILESALSLISMDAVKVHEAIGICAAGYSFAAPIMIRTLVDLIVSTIAVVKSKNPELAAFKYFIFGYRAMLRDHKYSRNAIEESKQMCRTKYRSLDSSLHEAARRFLYQEKNKAYWFQDDIPKMRNPKDILETYDKKLYDTYKLLSAAAHGGYFGLRHFRNKPNKPELGPDKPGHCAESMVVLSARMLLKQAQKRAVFQGVSDMAEHVDLLERIDRLWRESTHLRIQEMGSTGNT